MAVITSTGITFSDSTSLSTAAGSVSGTGYQKLANGIIIQWYATTSTNATYNFPIAFPNACVTVGCTWRASASQGGRCGTPVVLSKSTTQVVVGYKDRASAVFNGLYFFAMGY